MADEYEGKTLEELREILEKKNEKLVEVRGLRLQAEQDSANAIQAAQLRAEIERVDGHINLEVSQLAISLNQNPDEIGAGVLSVDPNVGTTELSQGESPETSVPVAPVPELTPVQNAGVENPVAPEGAPSDKGGKN